MRAGFGLLTVLVVSLVACGLESEPDSATGGGGGGSGAGGEEPISPEAWSVGDCEAVAESSTLTGDGFFTSLSRVHAQRRFFGDHQDPSAVDQALVQALRSVDPEVDADAFITTYVSATPGSCARMGAEDRTGMAHVEMIEDVAWVRFGGGEFTIPNEATAVVVDLVGSVEGGCSTSSSRVWPGKFSTET